VFCLSHAGNYRGDLLRFAQLNRLIGPPYCFYGIQARGADGVSQPHCNVQEMAAAYVEEIRALNPDGPHFLIGECGAAPIAYETAQQLRTRGAEVRLLILLDAKGSGPFSHGYFWRRYIWYRYLPWLYYPIQHVKQSPVLPNLRRAIGYRFPEVTCLEGGERVRYVLLNSMKMLGFICSLLGCRMASIRPNLNSRQPGRAYQAETQEKRAIHSALHYPLFRMARLRYNYLPYAGKIAVVANEEWCNADPNLGWPRLARGGLEVHKIAGDHDTYITQNIGSVAKVLRDCLQRAESESAT
jgi:thioesterase domain-containing protein